MILLFRKNVIWCQRLTPSFELQFISGGYILPGSFLSLSPPRFRSRGTFNIGSLSTESWNQFQLRWSGLAPVHSYLSDLGKRAKRKIRFLVNALNKPETQQFGRWGRTKRMQELWDSKHQEVVRLFLMGQYVLFLLPSQELMSLVRPCASGMISQAVVRSIYAPDVLTAHPYLQAFPLTWAS